MGHREYDRLGVHIWLSLLGPNLEVRTKIREAVSYNEVLTSWADCYKDHGLTSWISG